MRLSAAAAGTIAVTAALAFAVPAKADAPTDGLADVAALAAATPPADQPDPAAAVAAVAGALQSGSNVSISIRIGSPGDDGAAARRVAGRRTGRESLRLRPDRQRRRRRNDLADGRADSCGPAAGRARPAVSLAAGAVSPVACAGSRAERAASGCSGAGRDHERSAARSAGRVEHPGTTAAVVGLEPHGRLR